MTVPATDSRAGPFLGAGVIASLPFDFKVFAQEDVLVTRTDVDGFESTLVIGVDYTVTLNPDQDADPGGVVTPIVAPVTGELTTLTSGLDYEQPIDLVTGGKFRAQTVENGFDRTTMLIKQLKEQSDRTLHLPISAEADATLPVPEANSLLGWNEDATALQNVDPTTLATIVAFGTAQDDLFSGDGVQTAFVLTSNPGAQANLKVSLSGLDQRPGIDYVWSGGTTLTFTSAPPLGINNILVKYQQALPQGYNPDLADTSDVSKGDALVGLKRTDIAGVASTLHLWHNAQIFNVMSDGGAVGDGDADDTTAIQDIATKIAQFQSSQITAHKLTKAVMFFPDGNYKITAAIKVRGFISIIGTATAYTGGSVVHQSTAGENIFEFYGSLNDNTSLGVIVEGMNFEFDSALPANNSGVALYFPKTNDIGGATLSSNSHYIRRNRFGGWHRNGRFIRMFNCNDVEISGNVVDVCTGGASIELGDDTSASSRVTDARIFGNGFYFCFNSIALRNVAAVSISANSFFNQFALDWTAISMRASGAVTASSVEGVSVVSNTFARCYTAYRVDGSVSGVNFSNNVHSRALDYPFRLEGATDAEYISWHNDRIKVASTSATPADAANYARSAVFFTVAGTAKLKNSSITDLQIDANGINGLNAIGLEQSGPTSPFGVGMTLRGNRFYNNTIPSPGANYQLIPCSAAELVLENVQNYPTSYPTSAPVFNLNTLVVLDSLNFTIDYDVTVDKLGSNIGSRVGRVQVSILRIRNGGSLVSSVTSVDSVGDDFNGLGGTNIPTVTFTVSNGPPARVNVTVTAASMVAPVSVTVRSRAHSFRATANPQIKCA